MITWTSRLGIATEADRLHGLQLEVYTAIKSWDAVKDGPGPTREQLAEQLNRKESSICGRVKELLDRDLIVKAPLVTNPKTGKAAETLRALAYRPEPTTPEIKVDKSGQTSFLEGFGASAQYH